jgi:hypothetical protein
MAISGAWYSFMTMRNYLGSFSLSPQRLGGNGGIVLTNNKGIDHTEVWFNFQPGLWYVYVLVENQVKHVMMESESFVAIAEEGWEQTKSLHFPSEDVFLFDEFQRLSLSKKIFIRELEGIGLYDKGIVIGNPNGLTLHISEIWQNGLVVSLKIKIDKT